ncbi:putative rRNA methylase (SpoU class), partial [Snodgrassella alvi SCGC AB-598-O11]
EQCLRIPQSEHIRSLNLSNAAAIVLYEALRQQSFPSLA